MSAPKTKLLTTSQAAEFLAIHVNTLRKWTNSGQVPATIIGRYTRRYDLSDLKKWLKRRHN